MRDMYAELIETLDGIAEDLNPTPEPETSVSDTRSIEIEPETVSKKSTRRK